MEQSLQAQEPLANVQETVSAKRCPYCHDDLWQKQNWRCRGCLTEHHTECAAIHKGCAVYGCRYQGRRPALFFSEVELPSSQEWTIAQRLVTCIWLFIVSMGMAGFYFFIQWLLETPTEFSIAELVIISVH